MTRYKRDHGLVTSILLQTTRPQTWDLHGFFIRLGALATRSMDETSVVSPPLKKFKPPPKPSETKFRIIIALIVYSAILGSILAFLPEEETPLDTIVIIPLLVLAVAWCLFDAKQRDHRVGCLMKLLLIFVFAIGFPLYLYSTRGIESFKTLGLSIGLVAIMFACMIAAGLLTLFVCDTFFPGIIVG